MLVREEGQLTLSKAVEQARGWVATKIGLDDMVGYVCSLCISYGVKVDVVESTIESVKEHMTTLDV